MSGRQVYEDGTGQRTMTVQDNNFLILYSAAFLRQAIASKDTLIFSIRNIQMHIIRPSKENQTEDSFSIGKLIHFKTKLPNFIYPADNQLIRISIRAIQNSRRYLSNGVTRLILRPLVVTFG